ncbi:MAG: hypothetical protein LM549_03015 [Candidatus Competibacter sp.]|nr:hypothetical protein [Candidatus Competibacter sp.]
MQEQLQQADEREQQAREREARLLALLALLETAQQVLQVEQQSRRDLETRLLPAPRPAPVGKVRAWTLLALLLVALATFMVSLVRPELIEWLTGS